jgi:hypothetical protein
MLIACARDLPASSTGSAGKSASQNQNQNQNQNLAPIPQPALDPVERAARQELLERLAPALSRSSAGLSWQSAGGRVRSMNLQGRYAHAVIAVRGSDGVVRQRCVDRVASARDALELGAAP